MAQNSAEQRENAFERFGLWLAAWSEKWFPDAWVFALIGIVVVFVFGVAIGESSQFNELCAMLRNQIEIARGGDAEAKH